MSFFEEAAEIARSAAEAKKITFRNVDLKRYQNPPADTCYPLEYAFHLLGDVHDKVVVDLGCGSGEDIVPLRRRGARVIGIDISPDLIAVAHQRLKKYGVDADLQLGSAYETGLPDKSVDVIFCIALLHHLDLDRVRTEIVRILKPEGLFIVEEPIRLSWTMKQIRRLLPARADVSENEYPLDAAQLRLLEKGFDRIASRNFRSPAVPLLQKFIHKPRNIAKVWAGDAWMLQHVSPLKHFASIRVMALRAKGPSPHLQMPA